MTYPTYFTTWLASNGRRCLLAEVGVKSEGVEITRYLSSVGFVTEPTDTPASTQYIGRISGGVSFSRSLSLTGEGSLSFGDIEMDNTDREIDDWLNDIWDFRSIDLYMGDPIWPKSQFVKVFSGVVSGIAPKDRYHLSLGLRDILAPLNAPISTAVVGGAGDNKDSLIPIALGEVFNAEPLLISTDGTQVYQVSLGAIEDVIEVRDNGYPVSYSKDLSNGKFTLTYARYGKITCDVQGAKVSGSYRNDIGGLVEWVGTTLGDGDKLDSGSIDSTALTAFRVSHAQPVGVWINDRANRLQVMQKLSASVGATLTATSNGKLKLTQVAFGTPVRDVTSYNMLADSFAPSAKPDVLAAIQLQGCRNWSIQDKAELAFALTDGNAPLLGDEWAKATAEDVTVASDYRQTTSPEPTDTLLIVDSDLQAEAARRLALWSVPRATYRFTGYAELLTLELGDTVTLIFPAFGLESGKPAVVVSLETDFSAAQVVVGVLV